MVTAAADSDSPAEPAASGNPTNARPSEQQGTPLRLGVLGCAGIARGFVRDTQDMATATTVAVASRGRAKADEFASTFNIPRAYGSYETLVADPDVDAIYIPLPNTMHAEWAVRAAEAGKHILCEKPLARGSNHGGQRALTTTREAGAIGRGTNTLRWRQQERLIDTVDSPLATPQPSCSAHTDTVLHRT